MESGCDVLATEYENCQLVKLDTEALQNSSVGDRGLNEHLAPCKPKVRGWTEALQED